MNKKLRYRKEHSASDLLSWYNFMTFLRIESVDGQSTTFTYLATKATEFGEITQNNGHYAVQGHRFWYHNTTFY